MKKKYHAKIDVALAFFLLTVSCATFRPQPISPTQTASSFENRTLGDANLKEFLERNLGREITPWPKSLWDFQALTLVAFYYHPDLDVARAKWGVVQAGVITAGQRPNPGVNFTPQYNVNAANGVSPWVLTFSFDIPIETAGKRGYRIAQARNLSEASRLKIATTAWQVRSRLRKSLLSYYAANQTEIILRGQLAIQEDLVKLMERRLTVGEVSQPDVTLAHISLDQGRVSLREVEKQSAVTRVQIANALGLPATSLDAAQISFSFLEKSPLEPPSPEARFQALLNRSDILGGLIEYAASQSALQLEIAKQYPDIHLGPGYEFDQGENKWAIGLSVTLPVFNQNQGPIAEAEARRKEASARFTALQAQVIGEVDSALVGYRAALRKLEVADLLVSHKEIQVRSVEAMFDVGEADQLALLGARLELVASMLSRLNALVENQQFVGLLEGALQRPLDSLESFPIVPGANSPTKAGGKN